MKLFVDDQRNPPDDSWAHAKTYNDALHFMQTNGHKLTHLSLDHDLGELSTGYNLVCYMEYAHKDGLFQDGLIITIHSANPAGSQRMALALQKIYDIPWKKFVVSYTALCQTANSEQ